MAENKLRSTHICTCAVCQQQPTDETAKLHTSINHVLATLDEKNRRRFVGLLATQHGYGGVQYFARVTGLSRPTILRGQREITQFDADHTERVRALGGGGQFLEKKDPTLLDSLEELMRDATAGDPITGLKWTHKSLRAVVSQLHRRGHTISTPTVARLLREGGYALRVNRKKLAGKQVAGRDEQFIYIAQQRALFVQQQRPVISVDTKKKELIGCFKQAGQQWRRSPHEVLIYDFRSSAQGIAIPYGIYDVGGNQGFVVIGTSHDTSQFAVAAIRSWWLAVGRKTYPGQTHLLIEADCGGSNGNRCLTWKARLQDLADEFGLTITVTHYPTGASKWNPIEHRCFNLISANWAGQPLESYETVIKYIRATKSTMGFRCKARLDKKVYATGMKIKPEEAARLWIEKHEVFPHWNYTINPRTE